MAGEQVLPQLHACAVRVARLDANGVPSPGSTNLIVTDNLTTLTATPQIIEGTDIEVRNACYAVCLTYKTCDRIKRLNLELGVCKIDPYLHEMLSSGVLLDNGRGAKGFGYPKLNSATCPTGVSIELWARRVDEAGSQDPDEPWAWWVLPRAYVTMGAKTFENGPQTSTFTGFAVENPNWYDGPANDWPDDSDRVMQYVPWDSIPEASSGYLVLAAS